jgi:polyphosphate kinase
MGKSKQTGYFINRELSWLRFNERVLDEANDNGVPLLEKLKFISIYCNNLDEFFMIRVGTLFDQDLVCSSSKDDKTDLTASEQLHLIFETTKKLIIKKKNIYLNVINELSKNNIKHLDLNHLGNDEKSFLEEYFNTEVLPFLSPSIIDSHHPFPHLENKSMYIGVNLAGKKRTMFGIIPMNKNVERIIRVPSKSSKFKFCLLEDLILLFANKVFEIYEVEDKYIFRITRNADINFNDDNAEDETDYKIFLKELLKKRKRSSPVRLEISKAISKDTVDYFCKRLGIHEKYIFVDSTPFELSYSSNLVELLPAETKRAMLFNPELPQITPSINMKKPIIPQVIAKDLLLSYPYESMKPFLAFLKEVSEDRSTISIKITLYRVSSESKIIEYLINAVENGKEVTAVVELRARFDEENNIHWANRLEEAGCKVIYGLGNYKVHSKILLVTRKFNNRLQTITQIGTGNYNEKTATVYTDFSLITSNQTIGADANEYFLNMLIGNMNGIYPLLIVAPTHFKKRMMELIDGEIEAVKNGKEGYILLKFNSLTDKELIDKLVEASMNDVKIDLIIRGICCLLPGVDGVTSNIRVISIVGRYLEHSRVFCFGTKDRLRMYLSSADWMTRNTNRRFEIACPVFDEAIKTRIYNMLNIMLKDNVKARILLPDGTYVYLKNSEEEMDSQTYFYNQAVLNAENNAHMRAQNENLEKSKDSLGFFSNIRFANVNFLENKLFKMKNQLETKKEDLQ